MYEEKQGEKYRTRKYTLMLIFCLQDVIDRKASDLHPAGDTSIHAGDAAPLNQCGMSNSWNFLQGPAVYLPYPNFRHTDGKEA